MSEKRLPDHWRVPLEEFGEEPESVEPPEGSEGAWYELYSRFATHGFIRATLRADTETASLRLQLALPTGSHPDREFLEAVRAEMAELLGDTWEIVGLDPDWQLRGNLDEPPGDEIIATFLDRLEQLGETATSAPPSPPDWLDARLGEETENGAGSDERSGPPDGSSGASRAEDGVRSSEASAGGEVFESIGSGESDHRAAPSGMVDQAGIANFEIGGRGGELEVRVGLDIELSVSDREYLGRALAHALQARYDLEVRPLSPEDDAGVLGESMLRLKVRPVDIGIAKEVSPEKLRAQVKQYFERLERFDGLGVTLADVLGLGSETAERPAGTRSVESGKRGSGRQRDRRTAQDDSRPTERSKRESDARSSSGSRSETPASSDGTDVVLDVDPPRGGSRGDESPPSGLEPGNYRDPRLLRDDATTSLVDVVLRHPGYAERKMGHNLSILLDVDYPDAMELVETAPRVIAWGVGRERGQKFKRVIERAGGKVVLVEPDSLSA